MTPLDLACAFLEKGREDEILLERIVSDAAVADTVFGFHAQQAVEKYLKAVLAIDQERPEKTHDLGLLVHQCRGAGRVLPNDLEEITELSPFAVLTRYPMAPTSAVDRRAALDLVVRARRWAEAEVESAS